MQTYPVILRENAEELGSWFPLFLDVALDFKVPVFFSQQQEELVSHASVSVHVYYLFLVHAVCL